MHVLWTCTISSPTNAGLTHLNRVNDGTKSKANEVSADLRETNAASSLKYALTDSFGAVTLTTTCLAAALVVMMHNVMGA